MANLDRRPERDFYTYVLSSDSSDRSSRMARGLARRTQKRIQKPVAQFLADIAMIPGIDAVAVEVFPNYLAVEWVGNIKIGDIDGEKGETVAETSVTLANGSTARTYSSSIKGVEAVYSAFHNMNEALKPTPNYISGNGQSEQVSNSSAMVSIIHFHNNLGGEVSALITRYMERRRQMAAFPETTPDSARSSFIALGVVVPPLPTQNFTRSPQEVRVDQSLGCTFVGQGGQSVGMAEKLAERSTLAAMHINLADEVLGYKLSELMYEGPEEELTRTDNAQPAIYTASYVHYQVLRKLGLLNEAAVLAGSSLGEYDALAIAGAFGEGVDGFVEGLKVVRQRGLLMLEASKATEPSGLTAVATDTTDQEKIAEFIYNLNRELGITDEKDDDRVDPTNINNNGQLIIGTKNRILEEIERILEGKKIKATRLQVSAAFHSHLMTPARIKMEPVLDNTTIYPIEDPNRFVFANATGKVVRTADQIRQALKNQVDSPVLYRDIIQQFPGLGVKRIAELGTSIQTGINMSFFRGQFKAESGKIILPGGLVAATYVDLSKKAA